MFRSKYRIGVKFIAEESRNYLVAYGEIPVYNGGLQLLRKIKNSDFSIETGLYLTTKAVVDGPVYGPNRIFIRQTTYSILYRNISSLVNCRYDKKFIYISTGPIFDYLLKEDLTKWWDSNSGLSSRKLNIGFNVNLGITLFRKKRLNTFFEVRYSKNLTSTLKADKNLQWMNFTNTGLALGLNYALHPRKKTED